MEGSVAASRAVQASATPPSEPTAIRDFPRPETWTGVNVESAFL